MWYCYCYRAYPGRTGVTADAKYHIDIHRQLYNHALHDYENAPNDDRPSKYEQQNELPDWKQRWPVFSELHSKAAQKTVHRLHDNLSSLKGSKENGGTIGRLKRQSPTEYRSVTYNQSGFDLDDKRGRNGYAHVRFSKIGWIPIRYHRSLPENATIKEITLKTERSGAWFVTFGIEVEDKNLPEKPAMNSLDASNSVGIDLGISNYIHTSDGLTVDTLDLDGEYERLWKAQRTLSRRKRGSNNWKKQRKRVASMKRRISRKVLDFQHKLTTWLVREYDALFVEDLDVQEIVRQPGNAKNKQDAAWRQFITLLEYKADLYGCHVVQVEAAGTTKECASCGVETTKPIWVREHSCPSCGFETDRDANAALNVLQRGFEKLGLGWPDDTPLETATATDAEEFSEVSASRVVETGTPRREAGSPAPPRAG